MSNPVLDCSAVERIYQEAGQPLQVLDQVELQVMPGERVAIIGSSGSGKTTLLNTLGGLEAPDAGEVSIAGEPLYKVDEARRAQIRNRSLGFVYQFHHLLPEFTALENVAMPLMLAGVGLDEVKQRSAQLLESVGLAQRLDHKPAQLSGGERQRVSIARALVTQPACVLMDEPTGNLDRHTAQSVQDLMAELNQTTGTAFVVVTHDPSLAAKMDRTLELRDGKLHPFEH